MPLLISPDRKQKRVEVAGAIFTRHRDGYFEIPNETLFVEPLEAAGWGQFLPTTKEGAVIVPDNVESAEFSASIIRCTCAERGLLGTMEHPGVPCPLGRAENLGIIASYYRNPFTRIWKRLTRSISSWSHSWQPS